MGFEIEQEGLERAFKGMAREDAKEAANRAFSTSQEVFIEGGDEHDWDIFPVVQSARPPQWDESEGGFVFVYPHPASIFFEDGTVPHEIVPDSAEALAFEWPEMAGEPFGDTGKTWDEVYADTWPTVFLPKVKHPGMPALHGVRRGMQDAAGWWRSQ